MRLKEELMMVEIMKQYLFYKSCESNQKFQMKRKILTYTHFLSVI